MRIEITPNQRDLILKRQRAFDQAQQQARSAAELAGALSEGLTDLVATFALDAGAAQDAAFEQFTVTKEHGKDVLVLTEKPQAASAEAD